MSNRSQAQTKLAPSRGVSAAPVRLLQRKCACGGSAGLAGECAECGKKRLTMQRKPANHAEPSAAPPVVHEALRSPGQSLDVATRAFFEPRFGHDFSRVRVHTDAKAAESARAVNALAYTVGNSVVFDVSQYAPATEAGRRLLAHELAHVRQQEAAADAGANLQIAGCGHPAEHDAERAADNLDAGWANRLRLEAPLLLRTCRRHSSEDFYRNAPNYCSDTGFSGSLHPGQTCYREVPVRSSYFDCPPGDQVCFDRDGGCHDSYDLVSTVKGKDSDGTCSLHSYCFMGHAGADIAPGLLGLDSALTVAKLRCIAGCGQVSGMAKFWCLRSCASAEPGE